MPKRLYELLKDSLIRENILLVFIISVVVSVIVFLVTYQIEEDLKLEKLNLLEREWNRVIDHYEDALNFLADHPEDFKNSRTILEVLKSIHEHFGDYIAYPIFATPEGEYFIFPFYNLPADYDPRERPWYRAAVENPYSAVISPLFTHKILGFVTFAMSRAILDENGNLLGVLGIDIVPEKAMKDLLPSGAYVMREDGEILLQNGKIFVFLKPEDLKSEYGAKFDIPSGVAFFKRSINNTIFVMQTSLFSLLENSFLHIAFIMGLAFFLNAVVLRRTKSLVDRELRSPLEKFSRVAKEYLRSRVFDITGISSNVLEINQIVDKVADMITIIESQREELEASYKELEESYQEIEEKSRALSEAYEFLAHKLADIVEGFDEPTGSHVRRVQEISRFLAEKMKLPHELIHRIYIYSPLHDIGKIKVPKEILNKRGKLTPEEWEIMKKHTIWGGELLSGNKELEVAKNIAMYHHENYDGTGYPFGLKNDKIPIEAQIVKLADVYDALRSERPYKRALTHEEAVRIILEGDRKTSPAQFHPKLIEVFKNHHEKIKELWEKVSGGK
ncbi:HD domain-containing phosphohydrolase [Thermotoga sp.]|uniref:HD domain-containing phosphohydrolase n=1 Tax=Thermotoga sp. TaxID=28240 RepID=UPI0025D61D89|nr:HD domain-containing phosphohydrolase [Thermotoga sp.]MCD6552126.1 HD domain-containing protein [Thermotoga sp.]